MCAWLRSENGADILRVLGRWSRDRKVGCGAHSVVTASRSLHKARLGADCRLCFPPAHTDTAV